MLQALNLNQLNVSILIQRKVEHQQLFHVDVSAYCACCVHRGALTAVYLSSASCILEKFFNPNSVNHTTLVNYLATTERENKDDSGILCDSCVNSECNIT